MENKMNGNEVMDVAEKASGNKGLVKKSLIGLGIGAVLAGAAALLFGKKGKNDDEVIEDVEYDDVTDEVAG